MSKADDTAGKAALNQGSYHFRPSVLWMWLRRGEVVGQWLRAWRLSLRTASALDTLLSNQQHGEKRRRPSHRIGV